MNNERIKNALRKLAREKPPDDVHEIADGVYRQFKRNLIKTELNLWERIMNNPMTKYAAAAAVLIIVALAGAQVFLQSGQNQTIETALQSTVDTLPLVQKQQDAGPALDDAVKTVGLNKQQLAIRQLEEIKEFFAAGDIDGLVAVLGNAEAGYENRIIAANFLAQIGDTQAIETLEELSRQWQGEEAENPFAAAIATIRSRQKKEVEPTPLADVPKEPVAEAETNEPVAAAPQETQDNTAEKIDLKLNLQEGQKYGMKSTVDQKVTQTVMGQQQTINQNMTFGIISEVLAIDANGIIALKATYNQIQVKMDGPMGLIEYDSTKPPTDVNNPQAKTMVAMWSAMAGESFTMDLTPKGKIVGIQDYDKMWERMMEKVTGDNPNMAQAMKDMIKNFAGEDRIKEMGGEMMTSFPDEPVAIGDMWYDITSIEVGFPLYLDVTYILKDRKDGIAFIDVISKMDMGDQDSKLIEMEGMKMNMQMTGTQTGTVEVDEATGWMIKSNINQNFSGAVKIAPNKQMPNGMSIPMTIQSKITVEPMEVK